MSVKATIETWFKRTGGGSMILPDAWFGRPYDNLHVLQGIQESEHGLEIELTGQMSLSFAGPSIAAD
jgi:hypothetical protein